MTTLANLTPYTHQSDEIRVRVADLAPAKIESLCRQNPELAERLHFPAIAYDNGVPADGLSGAGHG